MPGDGGLSYRLNSLQQRGAGNADRAFLTAFNKIGGDEGTCWYQYMHFLDILVIYLNYSTHLQTCANL